MGDEEPDLQQANRAWLAHRPKAAPAAANKVLEKAERTLMGAIRRGERLPKLILSAEKVREAHMRVLRAKDLVVAFPTDIDDDEIKNHRANLSRSITAWTETSVEEIVAFYRTTVPVK